MNILKIGDQEKAVCDNCAAFVTVTYKLRDVPFFVSNAIMCAFYRISQRL